MINFEVEKLSDEKIAELAKETGWTPLKVAINANGYRDTFKYWSSTEEMLCVKLSCKYGVVVQRIKRISGNHGALNISQLYASVIKVQLFVGRDGIFHDLNNNILPSLQDAGIICRIGDRIYVHPALAGMDEHDVYTWCNQENLSKSRSRWGQSPTINGYDADEVEKAIEFYRKAKALLNGDFSTNC